MNLPDCSTRSRRCRGFVLLVLASGAVFPGLSNETPEVMAALLEEANRRGLGSTAHLAQTIVAGVDAREAARMSLGSLTHFYGLSRRSTMATTSSRGRRRSTTATSRTASARWRGSGT